MMNKVLKTYEDGSQLTVTGAAVGAVVCTIVGIAAATATVKFSNWRNERWLRKNGLHQDQIKK